MKDRPNTKPETAPAADADKTVTPVSEDKAVPHAGEPAAAEPAKV
jgi:hypothetical protein